MNENYEYFHIRRIQDAIYGMATPCNDQGIGGVTNCGYLITRDATREARRDVVLDSLVELKVLSRSEREAVTRVLNTKYLCKECMKND